MANTLPAWIVPGAPVLVPDHDGGHAVHLGPSPMVPALVLRVLDRDGAMGGLVDVIVLGRPYDPDGGFRFGKDLVPCFPTLVAVQAAWRRGMAGLAAHAPGWNHGMNA